MFERTGYKVNRHVRVRRLIEFSFNLPSPLAKSIYDLLWRAEPEVFESSLSAMR